MAISLRRPSVENPRRFVPADSAQQLVGGFLLAGPFVVTQEVWQLAENMTFVHAGLVALLVAFVGYGALYKTHKHKERRDPDKEMKIAGVPLRFLSLLAVAYGSVALLALLFTGPETFDANMVTTAKAINIGAIFSMVGAATADSLF